MTIKSLANIVLKLNLLINHTLNKKSKLLEDGSISKPVIFSGDRQLIWQKGFVDEMHINLFILSRYKL